MTDIPNQFIGLRNERLDTLLAGIDPALREESDAAAIVDPTGSAVLPSAPVEPSAPPMPPVVA